MASGSFSVVSAGSSRFHVVPRFSKYPSYKHIYIIKDGDKIYSVIRKNKFLEKFWKIEHC